MVVSFHEGMNGLHRAGEKLVSRSGWQQVAQVFDPSGLCELRHPDDVHTEDVEVRALRAEVDNIELVLLIGIGGEGLVLDLVEAGALKSVIDR